MEKSRDKKPISYETIFRIMRGVTVGAASIFLILNLIKKNMLAVIIIAVCLVLFVGSHIAFKKNKVAAKKREFALSVSLCFLVFIISLFSGESYSDDFILHLAVIGMTGLYLEPKFTRVQIVVSDILFVIMYFIEPEKAGNPSQYILCWVCFTLAAALFYQTIERGRAFIEIGEDRAEQAEELLTSMRQMGVDLEHDFAESSVQIEDSTMGLEKGSTSIAHGARQMSDSCNEVHEKILATEQQIDALNKEVKVFEEALNENQTNMSLMNEQLQSVSGTIYEANAVFQEMQKQMAEIARVADELSTISFKVTLLSLNASIEAAHAGEAGAGFDVVASEMRELSSSSDMFSKQVSDVVLEMSERVEITAQQFEDSKEAIVQSETTMKELQESFDKLTKQFDTLYGNIEEQNHSVNQVDAIFGDLKGRVSEMHQYSVENQHAVQGIMEAMDIYKGNISRVIDNTKTV